MDLKQLQYFVACAQTGSFSDAAKILYSTQPSVSKVIKALEDALGIQLFERLPRGIRLTVQGQKVYHYACKIINEMNVLENMAAGGMTKWIRISLNPSSWFANQFVDFYNKTYEKNYHFQVTTAGVRSVMERVRDYLDDIRAYIQVYMDLEQYDEVTRILNYFIKKCEQDNASFFIYSMFMEKRIRCAAILKDQVGYLEYTKCFLESYWERGIYNLEAVVQAESAHNEHKRIMHMQKEITEQNEKLMIKSNHDALTGLPNRAYWHSYAEDALAKAIRNGTTFGVEILDIDFFKSVNDTYGHQAGDEVLRSFGKILRHSIGTDDIAGRFGGDEFFLFFKKKDITDALMSVERVMEQTRAMRAPDGRQPFSCSVGIAIRRATDDTMESYDQLLARADRALYDVKRSGKNNYKIDS